MPDPSGYDYKQSIVLSHLKEPAANQAAQALKDALESYFADNPNVDVLDLEAVATDDDGPEAGSIGDPGSLVEKAGQFIAFLDHRYTKDKCTKPALVTAIRKLENLRRAMSVGGASLEHYGSSFVLWAGLVDEMRVERAMITDGESVLPLSLEGIHHFQRMLTSSAPGAPQRNIDSQSIDAAALTVRDHLPVNCTKCPRTAPADHGTKAPGFFARLFGHKT